MEGGGGQAAGVEGVGGEGEGEREGEGLVWGEQVGPVARPSRGGGRRALGPNRRGRWMGSSRRRPGLGLGLGAAGATATVGEAGAVAGEAGPVREARTVGEAAAEGEAGAVGAGAATGVTPQHPPPPLPSRPWGCCGASGRGRDTFNPPPVQTTKSPFPTWHST